MIKIDIDADSRYPVDRELIRDELKKVLLKHNIKDNAHMSVVVVGKRKMKSLNEEHMSKKGVTDVLSFPLNDPESDDAFVETPGDVLYLGDVVVCYPVAMNRALKRQKKVDEIVVELAEHGLLHLLGIHHD